MDINKIVSTKVFKWSLLILAQIILLTVVFSAGVIVGTHKARFASDFGRNYERNFAGPARGPMGPGRPGDGFFRDDIRNAHGLAGEIVSVADNTIIVKDRQNNENTVAVGDKTLIKSRGGDLNLTDLKKEDRIVVVGKPDENGVINAELIRVFENFDNNEK